ncbi:MAG TPA: biopolymer transporter ExbD [Nitrospiraceae bacterium]|nr:biopolymer transporter ExbD [Nitrospiraceae bacterium]
MARRLHSKRKKKESIDTDIMHVLNLTPMMDILTVLVVFLLVTAVFLSITVMELSIPTSGAGVAAGKRNIVIEVIIRKTGLQISRGSRVEATIPKKDGKYDIETLSRLLVRLKEQYPGKQDATVLMEPAIEYDHLIQVMDAVRVADVRSEEGREVGKMTLFPNISIGDAP